MSWVASVAWRSCDYDDYEQDEDGDGETCLYVWGLAARRIDMSCRRTNTVVHELTRCSDDTITRRYSSISTSLPTCHTVTSEDLWLSADLSAR